jgi:hypothetical protein
MTKTTFRLVNDAVRQRAVQAILNAPEGYSVVIGPETRSQEQNRLMWPLIADMQAQNETMRSFTPDQVKLRFLNALDNEMKFLPELWGNGMFAVGQKSSTLSKSQFSMLIELMFKWGAENDIKWSRKALDAYGEVVGPLPADSE